MSYESFFLNAQSNIIQYELLEISHPSFSQTYYIVRNAANGLTVTHESGGGGVKVYSYYPLRITSLGAKGDLEQGLRVDLGDLGQVIPLELDAVFDADTADTKPVVKFRTYRSDDLTAPMVGPYTYEITVITSNEEGSSFEAKAPSLNANRTGEIYSFDRFEGLRGFL
jgi:hypothetical protein